MKILITGAPRSGKTTLLRKLIADIPHKVGFVTNEILAHDNTRLGFEIETHSGKKTIVAHVDFADPHTPRVARYGVDIPNLEALIPEVSTCERGDLLYIDEIGEMQLHSTQFKALVLTYLDAPNPFLATISRIYEDDFMKALRSRADVSVVEIGVENREEVEGEIRERLSAC